jgi:hypothetical protein
MGSIPTILTKINKLFVPNKHPIYDCNNVTRSADHTGERSAHNMKNYNSLSSGEVVPEQIKHPMHRHNV